MSDDSCQLCGNSKAWHEQYRAIHEFSPAGGERVLQPKTEEKPPEEPRVKIASGDPVLRAILIEKGIITYSDIVKMERMLIIGD